MMPYNGVTLKPISIEFEAQWKIRSWNGLLAKKIQDTFITDHIFIEFIYYKE